MDTDQEMSSSFVTNVWLQSNVTKAGDVSGPVSE